MRVVHTAVGSSATGDGARQLAELTSKLPLPEDYAKDVIYDNERADRLIIYATEPGISLMGDAEELFMDGTHSMKCPCVICISSI